MVFAAIVLVLLLGTVRPVLAQSGPVNNANSTESTQEQLLLEKARLNGSVRVILTLNVVFQPEGSLAGPVAMNAQREEIAQIQQALVDRIAGLALEEPYRYQTVPLVFTTLTAQGLQAALDSGLVLAVQEDMPDAPTLAESTPLIGATAAWASGFTGSGQTVAILDTGVDKTHPFLAGKVVSEGCYSTTDPNYASTSVCPGGVSSTTAAGSGINCSLSIYGCEHGTHVAGIAAGKGTTFSGVAKDARIIAIQIFSRFDSATYCQSSPVPCALTWTSDQIKGLERIYLLRGTYWIASVNMSLGGGSYASYCDSDSRKPIIDQLRAVGIATVIASGNNGFTSSISAPACISSAVSVGSTGDGSGGATTDVVSYFSNSASFLKLLAPGAVIYSSVPGGVYASLQGTSMAAPHVAGAWAVMKSKNPRLNIDQVLNALTSTGLMVSDSRNGISKPRIRLAQALAAVPLPPTLNKKFFVPLILK
jgi:subtilisin family serine protease